MLQLTLTITGMLCGMCEAHINDVIRAACRVKQVSSSHRDGKTVILTETDISNTHLRELIAQTGYELKRVERTEIARKNPLSFLHRSHS